MSVGDVIEVSRVLVGGGEANLFNDVYVISKADPSTPNVFDYSMRSVPPTAPDPQPYPLTPRFVTYAQTRRVGTESNLLDLYKNSAFILPEPQGSISVVGQETAPVFPGWIFRDNAIRHKDGIPTDLAGSASHSTAVRMHGLAEASLESNIIDVEASSPIQILSPFSRVRTFNNIGASGVPVFGTDLTVTPPHQFDEAVKAIDDILTVCFL
jgi:hypothetical protein